MPGRLRFIADVGLNKAEAQATVCGVPGSGSVDELRSHDPVEIVVNLTVPMAVAAAMAMRALEAGKWVWSEKPLAVDRCSGRAVAFAAASGLGVASAPDTSLGPALQSAARTDGLIEAQEPAHAFFRSPGIIESTDSRVLVDVVSTVEPAAEELDPPQRTLT
nr:Gfo/Idh/MocA family oxidoreductase [Curtobacterium sp. UNCCL20]